jgi:diacylglycerol kinase (ATP)
VRVTLIHHPAAGGRVEGDTDALIELLRTESHEVCEQSAAEADWERALDRPADVIAVAGGDGTVSRVAKLMVGRRIPLAPLPAGTANNICRTLGLAGRHWEELVRGWPKARRAKLDVGTARGPWGERSFVEGVGAGLFACLLSSDDADRKLARFRRPQERVSYALELLNKRVLDCEPIELSATLDGKDVSGRYLLFEVLNILYIGPSLFLAPDSQPGDGQFDLVLVSEAERERLQSYLASWQTNRERLSVLPSRSGRHFRFEWTGFELHIDDELWPPKHEAPGSPALVELDIEEQAVEFLAPDSPR